MSEGQQRGLLRANNVITVGALLTFIGAYAVDTFGGRGWVWLVLGLVVLGAGLVLRFRR